MVTLAMNIFKKNINQAITMVGITKSTFVMNHYESSPDNNHPFIIQLQSVCNKKLAILKNIGKACKAQYYLILEAKRQKGKL